MNSFVRCTTVLTLLAAACLAQASGQTVTPGSEFDLSLTGRVNMEGTILSSACDIDTGDGYQTVDMGTETRGRMVRMNEGDPHPFSIALTHCSLADADNPLPWQLIRITFDGEKSDGLFQVSGVASGVALEVTDVNGNIIRPGETMPYKKLTANDIRFDYQIKLKTTMRELMVGDYQAILRYRVEYF
jgi:type 1 fimbria pilin